ncbi:MAG: site-specific DNA-methyltransferase [Ardenticatenaceae bacterium]|nr:site-specific DNA-methyltransferase [Ardenticatenaceae bacterium]
MATGLSKTKWSSDDLEVGNAANLPIYLQYPDKKSEQAVLGVPPGQYTTLYQGNNQLNRLYFGDNLKVLSSLVRDPGVAGQVELVYIDPPFATGSVFQSRSQDDAYTDLLKGAAYLEFIRQRLILLRELLSDSGSIYVHLDANMVFAIKLIMDEVFGENNFRNLITRKKCNPKNYTRKSYGNISDYILFYTQTDNYTWNRAYEPWSPEDAEKEYTYIDGSTGRRYKKVPIHAPGTRRGETGQPWRGMMPPPGKHWQYRPSTLEKMDQRGEIYWSPTGNPRRKIFLDDSPGKPVQDIWLDVKDAHNQNIRITGYPTEKNPHLLERIIEASSNPGDLVLDCFCGSGTTLAVADQLGRNWIGADSSTEAMATTLRRFTRGTEIMGDFVTKKDVTDQVGQMSLFDDPGEVVDTRPSEQDLEHQSIEDFGFYCEVGLEEEISEDWNKWLAMAEITHDPLQM